MQHKKYIFYIYNNNPNYIVLYSFNSVGLIDRYYESAVNVNLGFIVVCRLCTVERLLSLSVIARYIYTVSVIGGDG